MLDSKPRLLPDTGQRVGHAEFLGFGSHDDKNKRRVHPLDLTESGHLSQLQLDKKTRNRQLKNESEKISFPIESVHL